MSTVRVHDDNCKKCKKKKTQNSASLQFKMSPIFSQTELPDVIPLTKNRTHVPRSA